MLRNSYYWEGHKGKYSIWFRVACIEVTSCICKGTSEYLLSFPFLLALENIVTCSMFACLMITGSGVDDFIYWHFFTITTTYNSSQSMTVYDSLHSLLDYECLLFHLYEWRTKNHCSLSQRESQICTRTDGQSASLSWNKAPTWGLRPDFYYCRTVEGLLTWGTLSDERTCLSFTIAAGPRQRSHSRVLVPWESWPYCTVSNSRLPFTSSPTNRRATVEVFDPASTREAYSHKWTELLYNFGWTEYVTMSYSSSLILFFVFIRCHGNVLSKPLPSNGYSVSVSCSENVIPEPLPINGHIRHSILSYLFKVIDFYKVNELFNRFWKLCDSLVHMQYLFMILRLHLVNGDKI
jgi:hypothetical protein